MVLVGSVLGGSFAEGMSMRTTELLWLPALR